MRRSCITPFSARSLARWREFVGRGDLRPPGGTRVTLVNFVVMAVCALLTSPAVMARGGNFIAFLCLCCPDRRVGSALPDDLRDFPQADYGPRAKGPGGSEAQAMREAATDLCQVQQAIAVSTIPGR